VRSLAAVRAAVAQVDQRHVAPARIDAASLGDEFTARLGTFAATGCSVSTNTLSDG
jgi:hypothetical protein